MNKHNKYWHLIILFLCGLLLLSVDAFAADKVLDASLLDNEPVSLTEYFAVLEDPGLTLTLADVQKPDMASRFKAVQAPAEALNYGYTNSAYWLRLSLSNTGDHPVERMLEIAYWGLANIQFYQTDTNGSYRSVTTGAVLPFATRPYPNHYFVFPLVLPEHSSQVVYLRIQSSPITIPARLWTPQAFHVYERNYYIGQTWYFGMAVAMAMFNLLLFFALRDVIYLQYVGFVSCMAFALAAHNGLVKEFLPLDSYTWSNMSVNVGYSLTFITGLLLTRSMLNTGQVVPRLDRWLKIFVSILLLSVIAVAISYETFGKSLALLYIASVTLILGTGVFCAMKRQRSAYFFVTAFTLTGLGGMLFSLRGLGLLPSNAFTFNGLQIGSALEMLLLAFALADRFNMIRRKAIDDVKQANINLEQRLQAREAELDIKHEKLRESEEFLKEAQHIAGLGSYVLDIPSGRWTGTDSIPQMFGMNESYEHTYGAWAELVHPDDRAMITSHFENLILTQNEVFNKAYRIIRLNDSSVRWLHGMGRLSFDDQGRPLKMLGTIWDVTEQHQREVELAATHERLREIERYQTLSQERQRLMQDMHDGLGSSLTSALRVVEHGRMDETVVAQVLKGCIDDLKLAIDSMEPVDADLLLLLATLRYRLGPRLESTGIALRWEVKSVPKLDWLDPKNSLHILRILQEAFTNIIKHTNTTEIRVATRAESDHVVVTITDNGQGFAVENALKSGGKGLSNQMRRAEAIGAEVNWKSNDAGTCFTLRLPIKRKPSIE
jgi:signal transduction histidine kinase